ncbi:hypothetical protein HanPSC8_Chr11g0492311 [Helianthus annuus]|nr:hypothetical protein HanPSC8_Chr11g0492311 [Helianthus annuus]
MDMKQKLEGKFLKEFVDPPKESTTEERAKEKKEHEEAINRYIENPPRTANQKLKKKMVVMRNVGAETNLEFGDKPDRYVITTEKDRFDEYGNRSGILSWAYIEEKGMFIVKRGNGEVEYYDHSDAFESWTVVDLRELSRANYHDQTINPNCKIGWNFFNKLQQQAKVNFKDIKLAQSILLEDEDVLDPATDKPYKTVMWPATKQTKTVPLLKELPDDSLKDLRFWMYDPVTGQVVIVCENAEYRIMDTRDLMHFRENDIKILSKTHKSDPKYEVYAKSYTGAIAQIMLFKLWSGQRTR